MKRSGLKYFFGHWLTTNHEYIAMLFFFFVRNNHIQSFFYFGIATAGSGISIPSKYEKENVGEKELADIPCYYPREKKTSCESFIF